MKSLYLIKYNLKNRIPVIDIYQTIYLFQFKICCFLLDFIELN